MLIEASYTSDEERSKDLQLISEADCIVDEHGANLFHGDFVHEVLNFFKYCDDENNIFIHLCNDIDIFLHQLKLCSARMTVHMGRSLRMERTLPPTVRRYLERVHGLLSLYARFETCIQLSLKELRCHVVLVDDISKHHDTMIRIMYV